MKYTVGEKATFSKTITEADINTFAGICGDFNPVHVNTVEAGKSIFGRRVAHGMLGASFISTVLGMYLPGPGTVYLSQKLQFKRPVYIGDTISAVVELKELMDNNRGRLSTEVINEKNEIVIAGEAVVIMPE